MIRFTKMHSAARDFLIIDSTKEKILPECYSDFAAELCQRRISVGADGLILISGPFKSTNSKDFLNPAYARLLVYDSSGGRCELDLNGISCAAKYCFDRKQETKEAESLIFETDSGQVYAEALNNCNIQITIDSIKVIQTGLSPETGGTVLDASYVEIGKSPHLVVEYDYRNKDERELWLLANRLRHHCGLPKGPNVNFYKRTAADTIEIKTYKKGIEDFVCSCGEGACAVMAATAVQSMYSVTEKKFRSAGGLQTVEWVSDKDRSSMIFIAEAETVFEGIIK